MVNHFIKRIYSVRYALRGCYFLIRDEASIQIQLIIAILITGLGFYLDISTTEWMLQCFAIGLVLASEGLNTAIEEICNYIQPEFDSKIGRIKDLSAGAVTFAAMIAIIIGCIIYIPKLF